eukprot:TRINITY_DN29966_c0_g1_i1.p2 TRINITY_DN29966_c0_g1~~TRINITY_DN29966_c0_g1_i1.p2  ORF type:complete len:114 (+),score=29.20 TRINITY_DN29966_c0_g1_i1:230-571(+)
MSCCGGNTGDAFQRFIALSAPSPDKLFEFVQETPGFATAENVSRVQRAVEEALRRKDPKSGSLTMKALMLEMCVNHSVDTFLEALTSDPPNALCNEFQAAAQQRMRDVQARLS